MIRLLVVLSIAILCSCGNAPQRPDPILDQNYQPTPVQGAANTAVTPPTPGAEPAQNAAGVWHYTCSAGCAGGAGSAVPCATCGATLVHNQTYHGNANQPATTTTINPQAGGATPINLGDGSSIAPMGGAPATPSVTTPPKAPEPAQNAAGVWHFTCSAGCAGGAGSAIACAGCGATLVHNQTYHN